MEIAWPTWPNAAVMEDTGTIQGQTTFANQLFLMAYRCLLQLVSQLRGLSAANEYAANDQRISELYMSTLKERKTRIQHVHEVFSQWKSKYDRRLKNIAALPMKHRIVPVKPTFPTASVALTPAANGHIATTVYPEERELPDGTTGIQHWMVITIETEHRRILDPLAEAMAAAACQTLTNGQASVYWTIRRFI